MSGVLLFELQDISIGILGGNLMDFLAKAKYW